MLQKFTTRITILRLFFAILFFFSFTHTSNAIDTNTEIETFKHDFERQYKLMFSAYDEASMLKILTLETVNTACTTENTDIKLSDLISLLTFNITEFENQLLIYSSVRGYNNILSGTIDADILLRDNLEKAFIDAAITGHDNCLQILAPKVLNENYLRNRDDLIAFKQKYFWQHFENDQILKIGLFSVFAITMNQTHNLFYSLFATFVSGFSYTYFLCPTYTSKYDINLITPNNAIQGKIQVLTEQERTKVSSAIEKYSPSFG